MSSIGYFVSGAALLAAGLLVACLPGDDSGSSDSDLTQEKQDALEGAYIKQVGTPVHFVFKRGEDGAADTFLGDIKPEDAKEAEKVTGKITVSRDNLGTTFTLKPSGGSDDDDDTSSTTTSTGKSDSGTAKTSSALSVDGGAGDSGAAHGPVGGTSGPVEDAPADERSLAMQAFSGTMHYLKIGKNQTILVRGDTSGKTAQYKKVRSWCSEDSDCDKKVQATGLTCAKVRCSSKKSCACD